jgi:muconolactone delta-isomerase
LDDGRQTPGHATFVAVAVGIVGASAPAAKGRAMQFIAITRRRTESFTDAQFAEVLGPEADRARALYAEGVFRALYSRGDVPGAVIVLEAADAGEAERHIATLPFARAGLMDVQIVPLTPYRGFVPQG